MKSALRLAPLALALLAALPAPLPAQNIDPAEARRMEAIAAEVHRRREAEAAQRKPDSVSPAALNNDPMEAQRLEAAAEQTRANRAAREALNKEVAESAPKFDLDFPGGTPAELVAAIEKASGAPLNVIIPDEHAAVRLPPLRLNQVHTSQIFNALTEASKRLIRSGSGTSEIRMLFLTKDPVASASSLWFFQVPGQARIEPITRLFPLAYYLQSGLTVDDITTAIRTSWEMRGEAQTPAIKFHQETQLLIAVGQPEQLAVIGDVLEALKTTVTIRENAAQQAASHKNNASGTSAH